MFMISNGLQRSGPPLPTSGTSLGQAWSTSATPTLGHESYLCGHFVDGNIGSEGHHIRRLKGDLIGIIVATGTPGEHNGQDGDVQAAREEGK